MVRPLTPALSPKGKGGKSWQIDDVSASILAIAAVAAAAVSVASRQARAACGAALFVDAVGAEFCGGSQVQCRRLAAGFALADLSVSDRGARKAAIDRKRNQSDCEWRRYRRGDRSFRQHGFGRSRIQ